MTSCDSFHNVPFELLLSCVKHPCLTVDRLVLSLSIKIKGCLMQCLISTAILIPWWLFTVRNIFVMLFYYGLPPTPSHMIFWTPLGMLALQFSQRYKILERLCSITWYFQLNFVCLCVYRERLGGGGLTISQGILSELKKTGTSHARLHAKVRLH